MKRRLVIVLLLLAASTAPAAPQPDRRGEPAGAPTVLELHGGRFVAEVTWRDFNGRKGRGRVVELEAASEAPGEVGLSSRDSAVLRFFEPDNWEVLIKVLDGRRINDRFWVYLAAATNVGYYATVTDTRCAQTRAYINPIGRAARAITDVDAFEPCERPSLPGCFEADGVLCLGEGGRFRVEVTWSDYMKKRGYAHEAVLPGAGPARSRNSGVFYFFQPANWEVLVKVLDGCSFNGHFWVFGAASTNVAYTLTVTDRVSGQVRTYTNPLGTTALAVDDTLAFATCGVRR